MVMRRPRQSPSEKTYAADSNILLARVPEDLGNDTLLLELEVHLGLIGLDLDKDITRGDGIANLLLPGADVAGLHGWGQSRHLHDLVIGERGVASDDVGGETLAKGIVRRGEDAPPESGAQHGEGCVVGGV